MIKRKTKSVIIVIASRTSEQAAGRRIGAIGAAGELTRSVALSVFMLRMKVLLLATILGFACICGAEDLSDTKALLEMVLSNSILPDLIKSWEIPPDRNYVVLSDRSIGFDFPQSAEQALQEEELDKRVFKDVNNPDWKEEEKVDRVKLWYGNPDPCCDFILPKGHVIPKAIVASALKARDGIRLPTIFCKEPLDVVLESAKFIQKKFKRPTDGSDDFIRKYPKVAGIIHMTLPAFNSDRTLAGLYYTVVPTRFGGFGEFILLERVAGSWTVKWSHTVWFE